MLVTRTSTLTGKTNTLDLDVTQAQLNAHASGQLAQEVFPNLSRDDREFIISGITPKEWKAVFG